MLLEKDGILPLLENWTDKNVRFPPQLDDLEFLYSMIREMKSKVIMEFGIGYSTLVIAKAIEKNKFEWDGNVRPFKTKTNLFTVNVIEANNDDQWVIGTMANLKSRISVDSIRITSCCVLVGLFRDMVCHYYKVIPNVLPDFIYLDGPDPKHVIGSVRGISFNHPEALPMAADLLFIEPILLPGTVILVDGRTANVRFLERNFQRNWICEWLKERDMTLFKLNEEPLRYEHS